MSNILKLFISVAKAHGYRVIIACSNNDKADELSIMSDFYQAQLPRLRFVFAYLFYKRGVFSQASDPLRSLRIDQPEFKRKLYHHFEFYRGRTSGETPAFLRL